MECDELALTIAFPQPVLEVNFYGVIKNDITLIPVPLLTSGISINNLIIKINTYNLSF